MTVAEGEMAPDFEMPATGGRTVSLTGYKGKPFILYFYPKADTPGCTKEACAFQEAMPEFEKIGLDVIGVSPDKIKPIEKFAAKYGLTFPLASDEFSPGGGPIRNLGREVDVWPEIHGDGANDFPDRRGRQVAEGVAQGQRNWPRRRRHENRAGSKSSVARLRIPDESAAHARRQRQTPVSLDED